ncbi:nitrile hydratase accessory protein [Tistrella bauzanensis]|uniref:Nitrile hydratase accessory protein n=1 Tax=Tistrella arctica TaxID=3133430 RepID=A0ABU9YJA4_9PROT
MTSTTTPGPSGRTMPRPITVVPAGAALPTETGTPDNAAHTAPCPPPATLTGPEHQPPAAHRPILMGQPADADGPVFREPWEAQAFALAVALNQAGLFTWSEWAATISARIVTAQLGGDPDTGATYYHHWLAALEDIGRAKGL